MSAPSPYDPPQAYTHAPLPQAGREDAEQLQLLSIFYFVVAGLQAFSAVMGLGMLLTARAMLSDVSRFVVPGQGGPQPPNFGGMFSGMATYILCFSTAGVILHVLCGMFLRQRVNWTFCFVVACITCLSVPIGTALGVFTIIVLQRPGVKQAFGQTS